MSFWDWFKPRPKPPLPPPPPPSGSAAEAVVALVNRERSQHGLPALTLDTRLVAAAQKWAAHMAATGRLDHGSPGPRIAAEGYAWTTYGENIAEGYPSPEAVVAGWMGSPGHRANILGAAFRNAGAGVSGGFWCIDFAA